MATKKELIKITADLIRFKTTKNNPDEIRRCIDYIKVYFGKDFVIKEFERNNKPSLFILYKETKKPKLLLNGHIDVVEADDEQFSPFVKNGKLFGRGAVDMKSGVAASMLLMKEFGKKKDIALMIVADEEIGGTDGTGYLAEKGYGGKMVIAAEPNHTETADTLNIVIKEKGVLWIKVKTTGKACHGSRPWLGENAAEKLMKKYFEIKKLFKATTPKDRWKTTINLGKISSGDAPNRVPDKAEIVLDIRYTEATTPAEILKKIKKVGDIEIEIIEESPMMINKDVKTVGLLKKIVEDVTGKKCELLSEHGASDLRFFSDKNIPCAIFGPYGENYHGKDEFVYLSSLEMFYKIMSKFVEII